MRTVVVAAVVAAVLAADLVPGALYQSAYARSRPPAKAAASWTEVASFAHPTFRALACPSATTCLTTAGSGDFATVARTTDGGGKWVTETVPPDVEELQSLACLSTSICIGMAVGPRGAGEVALRTTDGGAHWVIEELPTGMGQVESISCPTTSTCQAVGASSSGDGAAAVRTTDGGAKWVTDSVPSGMGMISAVSCASPFTCEAVGQNDRDYRNIVLRTTDGGTTWTAKQLTTLVVPAGLVTVACRSALVCVAGGNDTEGSPLIIHTANGGRTWAGAKLPATITGSAGSVTAVACPSKKVCESVTTNGAMRTTDGSAHWVSQALPKNVGQVFVLACPSVTVCQSGGNETGSGARAVWLRTTTGGARWLDVEVPVTVDQLKAVSCPSELVCEAGGAVAGALRTTDGGTNWESQTIGVPAEGGQLDAVDCVTAMTCQGVGDYGGYADALRTIDGGTGWTYARLPSVTRLAQVSCPSLAVCEAVGYGAGLVVRTTDGGAKWALQPVPAPAASYPVAVTCPSTAVCMVVGRKEEGVALLRTADGGAHWVSEKVPADVGALTAIACPTTSICEAVGEHAVSRGKTPSRDDIAIRTTNGGASWVTTSIPGTVGGTLQSIACPTASICEAVGVGPTGQAHPSSASTAADAVAVRTTDRGRRWDDQALPTGVGNLYDVSCPSPLACVAVGYSQTEYAVVVRFG